MPSYNPFFNHPFKTSTGMEGRCEICGGPGDGGLHRKPYAPKTPDRCEAQCDIGRCVLREEHEGYHLTQSLGWAYRWMGGELGDPKDVPRDTDAEPGSHSLLDVHRDKEADNELWLETLKQPDGEARTRSSYTGYVIELTCKVNFETGEVEAIKMNDVPLARPVRISS